MKKKKTYKNAQHSKLIKTSINVFILTSKNSPLKVNNSGFPEGDMLEQKRS